MCRILILSIANLALLTSGLTAQQTISKLRLINADSNLPIAGFDPLPNNAILNLATLPTRNLNIEAITNPSTVGSVRFAYNANANFRTETIKPYALNGDNQGTFHAWTPSAGNHTVKATPYTGGGGGGTAGTTLTINFSVLDAPAEGPPAGRIAIVTDGNAHDPDDVCATPVALAMLRAKGVHHRLVHYSHSCELINKPIFNQAGGAAEQLLRQEMNQISCDGTASRWGGFDHITFWNCRTQWTAAVANLRAALNASTAADPLWIIEAGEPDIIYDAAIGADPGVMRHVSIITHHPNNDIGAYHDLDDVLAIQSPGAKVVRITDQNINLKTNLSAWHWARDHVDSRVRWLWERGEYAANSAYGDIKFKFPAIAGKFDCSDAGMTLYWLTGATNGGLQNGSPTDIRNMLNEYLADGTSASVLYSELSDASPIANGTLGSTANDLTVFSGRAGASPGVNRSPVFVFKLPSLGNVSNPFTAATFTCQLLNLNNSTPTANIDLYGLPRRQSAAVLPSDYFGDGGLHSAPGVTRLQDNFVSFTPTPNFPASRATNTSGSAALISYLNAQYASGAGANQYVFIRLSNDAAMANNMRFTFQSANGAGAANGGAGNLNLWPRISYFVNSSINQNMLPTALGTPKIGTVTTSSGSYESVDGSNILQGSSAENHLTDGQVGFQIENLAVDAVNGVNLKWQSSEGRIYTVLKSTQLDGKWTPASDPIPGTGGMLSFNDPAAIAGKSFYRIQVNLP